MALKLLRAERRTDESRASLVRDARLGALLAHPNVASTLELGEVDGGWFVAMELVEGVSTGDLVADGPLRPGRSWSSASRPPPRCTTCTGSAWTVSPPGSSTGM